MSKTITWLSTNAHLFGPIAAPDLFIAVSGEGHIL